MKKYIPNILTCLRIILSTFLFLFPPFSFPFTFVFIACGLTDVLDGYIARRMNSMSEFGAKLDSLADFVVIAIVFVRILPALTIPTWIITWLMIILLIRLSSIFIGLVKYRTICLLHTYANKATGLMIFSLPVLFILMDKSLTLALCCLVASIASVEELCINATSTHLDRDVKSILK